MTEAFTDSDVFVSFSLLAYARNFRLKYRTCGSDLYSIILDSCFLNQECTFPSGATPAQKATIVGSAIFINAVFFEGDDGDGGGME